MGEIERLWRAWTGAGRPEAVLATVVRTAGSTLRRAGARLLLLPGGEAEGFVSAGCVEADLAGHAGEVMATGAPRLVSYDPHALDDPVFGFGMGCRGTLHLLLERLPGPGAELLGWLVELRRRRVRAAVVTAVSGDALGRRLVVTGDGEARPVPEGTPWPEAARRAAEVALAGSAEPAPGGFAVEVVEPPPQLVVAGTGAVAAALVRQGLLMGWEVVAVATRPEPLAAEPFTRIRRETGTGVAPLERLVLDHRTAAVLLTHRLADDVELGEALLGTPVAYVGVMGSRGRRRALIGALEERGVPREALARLAMPVGLDLGAETAEELALAIAAEVQARLTGRSAASLSGRAEPVHART